MKKTILAFIILINSSIAQNNLKVERIPLEQGVSNNLIYSIIQDSKGFIWFGTMFGLIRYDGINYKTYRNNPNDTNSLSNDDIISIYEDKDGNLWMGTYNGGLNKYDRTTGNFTRYFFDANNANSVSSNTVWAIIQDKDGAMWFGTEGGGLNKFENGKFTNYSRDTTKPGSISGINIQSLATDSEGNLWAGTVGTGINKFDKEKNIFTNYRFNEDNPGGLSNNHVTSIFKDSDGDLWIGTGGGGLNKFDKTKGTFEKFKNDSTNNKSISNDFVQFIIEDSPGNLLVGTQNGLNKFNKNSGEFERIKIHSPDENKNEIILRMVKDKSGVLWVSSYLDGLYKLYYTEDNFKNFLTGNKISDIYEDAAHKLWVGTYRNGLQMSEDGGINFTNFIKDKNKESISSNYVTSVTSDREGNIWVGTGNGLNKLAKNSNSFEKYFNKAEDESSIGSNNIMKVYTDREGNLWIGTDNGLDKFIAGTNSFVHYRHISNDSSSLSENSILSIYEDREGTIWIGTYFGLNKLNESTGTFTHYSHNPSDPKSISNNYVFSFCEDKFNNFWIGTGGGLNIFDRNAKTFFHFTEQDGLPNSVISGLEYSDDGYLWISTYKGISRFDIKNRTFKNYDADDGLTSNMFNNGAYFKNEKGEIYFGGINGVNYFSPENIKQRNYSAPVNFTSLTKYDGKTKTEIDISAADEIKLRYDENFINLGFMSIDFTNPIKNKYAYMLEGFDKTWNYSGNVNEAVYTNLNPGEYNFKVKATNSDGIWNSKEAVMKIIVSPPFWKTWWFYGILVCLIISTIVLIQNYRVRKRVSNLIELEKIKEKERELMREQAARDYHDELGHKLTRISLYSRRINKKLRPTANGLTEDLNSIIETSNSLQSGAKDLIWAINPHEDSLYDLTVRLREFGNELFENTGVNFSATGITDEFKKINLSMNCKRHLIYIFKEGMNNILKYARSSEVNLIFNLNENELDIILKDNGIGFDIENCQKGYGLKNIFSRASQAGVSVKISSEEKTGTSVELKAIVSKLISA